MFSVCEQKEQHIAVLTFPFGTHGAPLLSLVQRLAKAAPGAKFSFLSTAKSNDSLFSSASGMENIKAYDVPDGVPDGYAFTGDPTEAINLFLIEAPENFRKGIEAAEEDVGRKVSCVITDAFLWFSCEMAERAGVPWIAFWTSGATPLSAHFYTDLIRQTVGLDGIDAREGEKLAFVPGFSELRIGDLPSGILFGEFKSPFSELLYKMGQFLPRANAVAINSFEELDLTITKDLKQQFSRFLNIGPFNLISQPSSVADEHGCIPWLDHQKARSVAYIGFGTVAAAPPHELKALAEAIEDSNTPFIWSLKDHLKCNLPEGFLERTKGVGKIVPWAPQLQVLAHSATGVFITHCGWNSVLESVSAGVPIIGRPFFGEQQLNVSVIERVWRIGVRIGEGVFTKAATMQALGLVLSSEEGMEMKKRVQVLREFALKSVQPDGSSTRNFATLLSI